MKLRFDLKSGLLTVCNVCVVIDDEDWDKIKKYKWKIKYETDTFSVVASHRIGPKQSDGRRKRVMTSLSRLLTNCPIGMVVDHISGDSLDNRKQNLRICTKAENNRNKKKQLGTKSKYKGVTLSHHKTKPWTAYISFNDKVRRLGYFSTEKEAALVYDNKAKELFGQFARLNFPETGA